MEMFKCISCGAEKESEEACSCSVCGYRMFKVPYVRSRILIKEIQNFIGHLKLSDLEDSAVRYYRKVPPKKADPAIPMIMTLF